MKDNSDLTAITVKMYDDNATSRSADDTDAMRLFLMITYDGTIVDEYTTENWDGDSYTWSVDLGTEVSSYKISAWADYGDTYYTVAHGIDVAPAVTVKNTVDGNDESRDAFYAIDDITFTGAARELSLELKRPFARLNVYSTDLNEETVYNAGFVPTDYKLEVTAPTTLNLLDGTRGDDATYIIESTTGLTYNEKQDDECLVSLDYFLAPEEEADVIDIDAVYYAADGSELVTYTYENIPLRSNYMTNITGNLITKKGTITVSIDQIWNGYVTDLIKEEIELPTSGSYDIVITKEDVESYTSEYPVNLVYILTGGGEGVTVNISFESADVAVKVASIVTDLSACEDGTSYSFVSSDFDGTVSIGSYYGTDETTALGDFTFNAPNASGSIPAGYSVENLYVGSAYTTFIVEEGAAINGDIVASYGKLVVDGTIAGTIYAENSTIQLTNGMGGYDTYASTAVKELYYTEAVGIDFSISSLVETFVETSITDYLDLGINVYYGGSVGLFDFDTANGGLDPTKWRNIEVSLTKDGKEVGTAKLKEDRYITTTLSDVSAEINAEINAFADECNGQAESLAAAVDALQDKLPTDIYNAISDKVEELETAVYVFTEALPSVQMTGANIPIGTIIPGEDNLSADDILAIVGTPEDEFSLTDAADYLSGDKAVTLYMLVNLANDINEADANVAALQEEIAPLLAQSETLTSEIAALYAELEALASTDADLLALEAEFNQLESEYYALDAPSTSGGSFFGGTSWVITPAYLNTSFTLSGDGSYYISKYYIFSGSSNIDATNLAKYTARNAKLDEITDCVSRYRAVLASLSGDINTEIATKEAELEVIGEPTDLSTLESLLGVDFSSADLSSSTINTLLSLLGIDIEVDDSFELNITDYLYSGELGDLYLELLQAQLYATTYSTMTETLGISDDVLSVIVALGDYLDQVAEILTEISAVGEAIEEFNPWEYSYTGEAEFSDGINGATVVLEFEYATGKKLYITNKNAESFSF